MLSKASRLTLSPACRMISKARYPPIERSASEPRRRRRKDPASDRGEVVIGPWIAETQAKKVTAQAETRTATGRRQMSRVDITTIVAALGNLARVIRDADPADKAELYTQLKLTLTYQPSQRVVEATPEIGANMPKGFVSEGDLVPGRGGTSPNRGPITTPS